MGGGGCADKADRMRCNVSLNSVKFDESKPGGMAGCFDFVQHVLVDNLVSHLSSLLLSSGLVCVRVVIVDNTINECCR
jgi:hypothetical protein